MASLFSDIIKNASTSSNITKLLSEATDWLRQTAMTMVNEITNPKKGFKSDVEIGKMYLFSYDPKLKKTLPYYDRYPLIFPIEGYSDGFLGINLHYLPPMLRARLLDSLIDTINNDKYDDSTKLKISYSILSGASKFRYFKPCVKRYLYSHIRSRFKEIEPKEWSKAILLPTQRFEKANESKIYQDSIRKSK